MNINLAKLEEIIKTSLSKDFPEFQSEVEPEIKKKIEFKEREVKVNVPVPEQIVQIEKVIPKVKLIYSYFIY